MSVELDVTVRGDFGRIIGIVIDEVGTTVDGASVVLETPSSTRTVDLEDERFQAALAEAIANLPERERLVLALYYDEELNLKEIGEVLGVSESRVSQLHSQCAARLRSRLGEWRAR